MIGTSEIATADEIDFKADLTLRRLAPCLAEAWRSSRIDPARREEFEQRLEVHWRPLFRVLLQLYGSRYDFYYHLERILTTAATAWAERTDELCAP